ncbi:MAG: S-layer homology domain-containing protein [Mycobacterium leprae]
MARRKPWIVVLVLVSLLAGLFPQVGAGAAAAALPLSLHGAVMTLQGYGVVDKKPEADLRLDDEITRAEFAKILGAALNLQKLADSSKERAAFPDTAGHWANGWIAVAKGRGLFLGRGDGRFYPEAHVTYAEVLTALLRLIGRADQANQREWPWGAVTAAADVGMIPADMAVGGRVSDNASRGDVFRLTATAIGRIKLTSGKSLLQQSRGDLTPPVLRLDGFPSLAERSSILVTGSASDAVAVSVQGQAVEPQVDGTFSAQVSLMPGSNQIAVVAEDGAGNRAEATAVIQCRQISDLQIAPEEIATSVGATFAAPNVVRYEGDSRFDSNADATWGFDTDAFTWDPKTGQFKALKSGEYTLRAIVGDHEATAHVVVAGVPAQVDLSVDRSTMAAGSAPSTIRIKLMDDQGRPNSGTRYTVSLTTVPDGIVTLETTAVQAIDGEAVVYMQPGRTAGAVGLQATVMAGNQKIQSPLLPLKVEPAAVAGIRLETTPAHASDAPGQRVQIVATAVDQSGVPIPATEDLEVVLSADNGVLSLTQNRALIKKGAISSAMGGGRNGAGVSTGQDGVATISAAIAGYSRLNMEQAFFEARASRGISGLQVQVKHAVAVSDNLNATVVAVSRVDRDGHVVTWDTTPVVLIPSVTTASVMPIADVGGVVTFAIRSSTPGRVSLTAGVPGDPTMNARPAEVAFLAPLWGGSVAQAVIKSDATQAKAGDVMNLYVALQDGTGGALANPGPPLIYRLHNDADGVLSTTDFVIPTGATRSDYGEIKAPQRAGQIAISGTLAGGKPLTAFQMMVAAAPTGTPTPSFTGPNLVAIAAETNRQLQPGEETRILIRARNGDQLVNDSFAFTVIVRLNGQVLTDLPPGLTVNMGTRSVDGLLGRTQAGEAEIWVRYTGVGTIEVEPVPADATTNAYDQWGLLGSGKASTGYSTAKAQVSYAPGPLTHLVVTTTPNLGDPLKGVIKASVGRTVTVRLAPSDDFGNLTGTGCVATLTRKQSGNAGDQAIRLGSDLLGSSTAAVGANGYTEFTVTALTADEGTVEWVPMATCGSSVLTTAQNVQITTTLATVGKPSIEFMGGNVSLQNAISQNDTAMILRIAQLPTAAPVEVLVYNSADNTLIGRYGPIYPSDWQAERRTITVPLSALGPPGRAISIRIRLNTGANVSDPSDARSLYYSARTQ